MEYYRRGLNCIKAGALLPSVATLPVCDELIRIKTTYKNDELDKIQAVRNNLDVQMGELERTYMNSDEER